MKLGKEAKEKLQPEAHWAVQALVDCSLPIKGKEQYGGVYYEKERGYWFSTDGFRIFGTSLIGGLGAERGKFISKDFAVSLTCAPIPEETSWFPDFSSLCPQGPPKHTIALTVPGVVGAADAKKYSGHMTLNYEKDGAFLYLSQVPEQRLAPDHIFFNMHYWSHLGGKDIRVLYYGKQSPLLVLPGDARSLRPLENSWFTIIMPTKDHGEILFSKTEG